MCFQISRQVFICAGPLRIRWKIFWKNDIPHNFDHQKSKLPHNDHQNSWNDSEKRFWKISTFGVQREARIAILKILQFLKFWWLKIKSYHLMTTKLPPNGVLTSRTLYHRHCGSKEHTRPHRQVLKLSTWFNSSSCFVKYSHKRLVSLYLWSKICQVYQQKNFRVPNFLKFLKNVILDTNS